MTTTMPGTRLGFWLEMATKEQTDQAMDMQYPELAKRVRSLLDGMSTRTAQRKTGVNYNTVANMKNGTRASMPLTIQFAQGFKVDPNPLLEASGYPLLQIPETINEVDSDSVSATDLNEQRRKKLDEGLLYAGFNNRLRRQIQEILKLQDEDQEVVSDQLDPVLRLLRRGATGFNEDRYPPEQLKEEAQTVRRLTKEEIERRYADEQSEIDEDTAQN